MSREYQTHNYPTKRTCTNPKCSCVDCKCADCKCNNPDNKPRNNLHSKEECPQCHFVFVSGFDEQNVRTCPSCKSRFVSGQKMDHGQGCSICSSRHRGSNNVYYKDGCPAIMSDGRFITYYNSTNELTEAMRKMNGFSSANQFRNFMQNNGDLFMNSERNHVIKENTCSPTIACSEGWYNLWAKNGGNWAANNASPYQSNQ